MPTFRRTPAATVAAIAAALLLALAATADAKPKPPPPDRPERVVDPATEKDPLWRKMLQLRKWYRTTFGIPARSSNVAVFHFRYPNGAEGFWAINNKPGKNTDAAPTGHAERRGFRILRSLGIDTGTVDDVLSEFQPCNQRGRYCRKLLARELTKARVGYLTPYPEDNDLRAQYRAAQEADNRQLMRDHRESQRIMNPGGRQGGGALPRALAGPRLGGIDFSSLELRYVSDTGGELGYAFRAPSSATPGDPAAGLATARQSSDAFFTWLALPPQSFWVNLNPSQPNRIIDPQLARTDADRVLLEADMQLKRTISSLTNPRGGRGPVLGRAGAHLRRPCAGGVHLVAQLDHARSGDGARG